LKYKVYWQQSAVDDLSETFLRHPREAHRIVVAVRTFGRDGRGDLKKLKGMDDLWRLRTGDWRVIVTIDGDEVWVSGVDNRRDAY
jgi:mRNA-degrading endonuclease RelE of RelBE toxin-antitoxin system